MLRTVLSVLAGVVAGMILALAVKYVGDYVFPYPPDVDFTDPASLKTLAGRVPAGALLMNVLAWTVGGFVGGVFAIRLAQADAAWPGWAVAGVLLLAAGWQMTRFPHPIWFMVLVLAAVPAAGYAAGWLLLRPQGDPSTAG